MILASGAMAAISSSGARAQSKPTLRVGVLTDLSGTYRDNTGPLRGLRPTCRRTTISMPTSTPPASAMP
jgi:hypothetical protein